MIHLMNEKKKRKKKRTTNPQANIYHLYKLVSEFAGLILTLFGFGRIFLNCFLVNLPCLIFLRMTKSLTFLQI